MRILVATDAWHPQVNGVVQTLRRMQSEVTRHGAEIVILAPQAFRQLACPGYPEIRLAMASLASVTPMVEAIRPDRIHIATEGPIGWAVRAWCLRAGRPFTTSYHTKFPEYAARILGIPASWSYAVVKRFHSRSSGVMVATRSLERELRARGFQRLLPWSRGVDTEVFKPSGERIFGSSAPVFLFVGRISREKSIEAFLDAELPGAKVVVGDGPHLPELRRCYPLVHFTGRKSGADLACAYASADVFVFPSRTDTFGLVLLEAMASGLPVAAYPVTGPVDVVEHGKSGVLDEDLGSAARRALALDRKAARERALQFTWPRAAEQFLHNIQIANAAAGHATGGEHRRSIRGGPAAVRPRGTSL